MLIWLKSKITKFFWTKALTFFSDWLGPLCQWVHHPSSSGPPLPRGESKLVQISQMAINLVKLTTTNWVNFILFPTTYITFPVNELDFIDTLKSWRNNLPDEATGVAHCCDVVEGPETGLAVGIWPFRRTGGALVDLLTALFD